MKAQLMFASLLILGLLTGFVATIVLLAMYWGGFGSGAWNSRLVATRAGSCVDGDRDPVLTPGGTRRCPALVVGCV